MRKTIITFIMIFMLMLTSKVSAVGLEVQAVVNGKIDKGENIEILININQISSLYAGDISFKYDPLMLKVKSIELGNLITNMSKVSKFDVIKKVDEQNGMARYAFSCLGQINGYSGSGAVVKISAQVLKKDNFKITSKPFLKQTGNDYNLKLQLCDSNVKELEYTFKPYNFSVDSGVSNSNTNTSANSNPTTDSTTSNTSQNKTGDIKQSSGNGDATTNINNSLGEKSTTEAQNKNDNKTTSASKKGGSSGMVYGVIGGLIVIAGGGGYFVWRKKSLFN